MKSYEILVAVVSMCGWLLKSRKYFEIGILIALLIAAAVVIELFAPYPR